MWLQMQPHVCIFCVCVCVYFYLASFPLQKTCAGVCSEAASSSWQTDTQSDRQKNVKILSVVWDRPRAHKLFKDRRNSSTLPVTKLCFYLGWEKKTKTKCRKGSQERKSRKGTSGNLLARHSVTCGDVKSIRTVSPEAVDPPHPSLSPVSAKEWKSLWNSQLDVLQKVKSVTVEDKIPREQVAL